MTIIPIKEIHMSIYFNNLTIWLYVLYVINKHIKFCVNQMLFTIWSINLFFMYNFRLQNF